MPSERSTRPDHFRGEYLTPAREFEIAELAEAVADTHFPKGLVIPEAIAKKKRISISVNDYGSCFDGLLEHRLGRFHIYCNTARSQTNGRRRFTLAHELGHFFIDEHRLALLSGRTPAHCSVHGGGPSINPVEREANHFASNLLVPPKRFSAYVGNSTPGLALALRVKARFEVSITSAALRLVNLNRCPCLVIKWEPNGACWKRPNELARLNGLAGNTIQSQSAIPGGTATARVISGETAEPGFLSAASTAAAWFPAIAAGSKRDTLLLEEAISLAPYGALTFLRPLEL
ncbi:MAG: ImmA/IrrE family metallo-endopeptidase [Planctomycetes bacterium]|nr:ImmA/IrrE family metallo-endopeptidase [Planctomycetota bacterium]